MKTAMQELLEYMYKFDVYPFETMQKKFLKKEKQQIINAVKETSMHGEEMATRQAEQYYNETFEQ